MADALEDLARQLGATTVEADRDQLSAAITALAHPIASRAARASGVPEHEVSDVAQDTCIKVLRYLRGGGRFTGNAEVFIWRTAENRARDLHRQRKRTDERDAKVLLESTAIDSADPRANWFDAERQQVAAAHVRSALTTAPATYRTALQRHYLDGESIEEIAESYYRETVAGGEVDIDDPVAVAAARRRARSLIDQHLKRGRDWLRKRLLEKVRKEGE